MNKKIPFSLKMLVLTALIPSAFAQDLAAPTPQNFLLQPQQPFSRDRVASQPSYRAWQISLAPLVASQAMDSYSSYGRRELNPALAGPDHRFGNQAAFLKLGIVGTMIGVEYLVVRKHPGAAKLLWKLNVASAAVTGATAAYNFSNR